MGLAKWKAALAVLWLAGCEAPLHTAEPLVPVTEPQVARMLVGTYAFSLDDSPDNMMHLRVWPEAGGRHLVEWYATTPRGMLDGLAQPMSLTAAALDGGRLLLEGRVDGEHFPVIAMPDPGGLLLHGVIDDRTRQIEIAGGLGLRMERSGLATPAERDRILRVLDAFDSGARDLIRAADPEGFAAAVDPMRMEALLALEASWRMRARTDRAAPSPPDLAALTEMAARGDPWAIYALARLHLHGVWVEQDRVRAGLFGEAAVRAGEPRGAGIAFLAATFEGDEDAARALRPAAEAAAEPLALTWIGGSLAARDGPTPEAAAVLEQAARRGEPQAQALLGQMLLNGAGVEQDRDRALTMLRAAGSRGEARAALNAATMLGEEGATEEDLKARVELLQIAAGMGERSAMTSLGFAYRDARGTKADPEQSVHWFRSAAEAGDPIGMTELGVAYFHGAGVAEDHAEAARWMRLGAEAGNAVAALNYGRMLGHGTGVPVDCAAARRWLDAAEAAGQEDVDKVRRAVFRGSGPDGEFRAGDPLSCVGERRAELEAEQAQLEAELARVRGRWNGMQAAADAGAEVAAEGAWRYWETVDPMTDERRQFLLGVAPRDAGVTFDGFVRIGCYDPRSEYPMGLSVSVGAPIRDARQSREQPAAVLTMRIDSRPAQDLLFSLSEEGMVAFPPNPLLSIGAELERGFAEAFGLAPGAAPVAGWEARQMHALLLGAEDRLAFRTRDVTGIDRTIILDMAGYRTLATRFRPHCAP